MHPVSKQPATLRRNWMAIALVLGFAIAAFFLTRPQAAATGLSPVAGLMTLKASAQTAMPYDQAMANPNPTLVEFYANWCTTCQAIAPTLEAVHTQFGDQLNFVMLNIDDPQWREQVQQFRVSGVPHLTLLGADQSLVDTFVGKVPKAVITQSLADLLGQ